MHPKFLHFSIERFLFLLGVRIKRLRKQRGINQMAFAFDCEMSRTQLHHIEKGEVNMRLSSLIKIASEFEVPLSDLLYGLENDCIT